MSSVPTIHPSMRRRGLATVAGLAGAGATLSLVALASPSSSAGTTLSPAAGAAAPAAVSAPAAAALVAPAARSAQPAARVAPPAARTVPRASAPAEKAAAPHTMTSTSSSCAGLNSSVDAFLQHFYAAHLALSPTEQVADAADADTYTRTHTVLIGNMIEPLVGGADASVDTFLQHVYAAHLALSPTEQVADAADLDQYVKTHTVMVENMAKPVAGC